MKNMKKTKLFGFFTTGFLPGCALPGFLAALLLAGCFNPITAVLPKTGGPAADPFTFDIMINKDGSARSIAGPDSGQIKGDIRNFIQLIVVNDSGNIVAFDEVRRVSDKDKTAILSIDSIPFGQNYHFLLLMGHWEHDGSYNYVEANLPTLLAAGLMEHMVTGSGKLTVVMWPIVVDTVFTTSNTGVPTASRTAEPEVNAGKPEAVSLLPVDWGVTWTVKKGISGNGFADLVKAQKVTDAAAGNNLKVKSKQTIVKGTGLSESAPVTSNTETENIITLGSIGQYTSGITRIGTEGSVAFKLEYVPFNLTTAGTWTAYDSKSKFDLSGNKAPVWIIRNGVNDLAQNNNTDFNNFGKAGYASANGNGAAAFKIAAKEPADPKNPQAGDLVIRDGKFKGLDKTNSTKANIEFITGGYTGTAEVYYTVVDAEASAPKYSGYTWLDSVGATVIPVLPALPVPHGAEITLPGSTDAGYQADGNYDVYVILFKDGTVSAPIKINTGSGNGEVGYEWGQGRFVAVSGGPNAAWSDDGGETWTAAALPGSFSWDCLAYGNGVFVTVASGNYAAWSDDGGEIWTAATLPYSINWSGLAYGNGVFVAVAQNSDKVARSKDGGKNWMAATLPSSAYWSRVAYGDGIFVTVTLNTNDEVAWSDDGGETWTAAALPSSASWYGLAYGNGVFVVVAVSNEAAWSDDGGKTWNMATLPSSAAWRVNYGNGIFVAIAEGDDKTAWSDDGGKTWTETALPDFGSWFSVTYGDGMFVAVSGDGHYDAVLGGWSASWSARSVDNGKTWIPAGTLPASPWPEIGSLMWTSVAYGE
ncbi:MAG: glycoside hydrolase [Treponema sp.]|nr:glycoside hydrolase [Treponema sp.]